MFSIDYQRPLIVSRNQFIKDTAGKVVDTIWFYKNVYKAITNGSMEIYNKAHQAIYNNNFVPICLERAGQEFNSERLARQQSRREADKMEQDFIQSFIQGFSAQTNQNLDKLLGIYPIGEQLRS